jgi:hypothetical protein
MPPAGAADPIDLRFAVEFVVDDVSMLSVEGLVAVLRLAWGDRRQRLWTEQALRRGGMTPALVWEDIGVPVPAPPVTREERLQARIRRTP